MCRTKQFLLNHRGMTLVELMVAIVALALIVAAASSLILAANSNFRATSIRADLSRRAHTAVDTIALKVRDASIVEQQLNGYWKVTVFKGGNSHDYLFSLSGGRLLMTYDAVTTVVTSDVSSFAIVPFLSGATFAYRISITLERGSVSRSASTIVSLRR